MAAEYEAVREEFKGWDIEDLLFGLRCELSLLGKKNYDAGLVSVYLDALDEKLSQAPVTDVYESYENFRKKVFEIFGMELPPT